MGVGIFPKIPITDFPAALLQNNSSRDFLLIALPIFPATLVHRKFASPDTALRQGQSALQGPSSKPCNLPRFACMPDFSEKHCFKTCVPFQNSWTVAEPKNHTTHPRCPQSMEWTTPKDGQREMLLFLCVWKGAGR